MGFFDNFFSFISMNTYKGICKAMIRSYNMVKRQNPDVSKRELYALALSLRPTWKRKDSTTFTFYRGDRTLTELTIEKKDTFQDVLRTLIYTETSSSLTFGPNLNHIREVEGAIAEALEDFKE